MREQGDFHDTVTLTAEELVGVADSAGSKAWVTSGVRSIRWLAAIAMSRRIRSLTPGLTGTRLRFRTLRSADVDGVEHDCSFFHWPSPSSPRWQGLWNSARLRRGQTQQGCQCGREKQSQFSRCIRTCSPGARDFSRGRAKSRDDGCDRGSFELAEWCRLTDSVACGASPAVFSRNRTERRAQPGHGGDVRAPISGSRLTNEAAAARAAPAAPFSTAMETRDRGRRSLPESDARQAPPDSLARVRRWRSWEW